MQGDVEHAITSGQCDAEQALDQVRTAQQGKAIAQAVHRFVGEQARNGLAEHVCRRLAEMLFDVGRDAADPPVGGEGNQEADVLDGPFAGWPRFLNALPHNRRHPLPDRLKHRRDADQWRKPQAPANTRSKIRSMRRK